MYLDMEKCFQMQSLTSTVVSISWENEKRTYKQQINVKGTDLQRLRQVWESSSSGECWLNDNV